MTGYTVVKFLHVFVAIVLIGGGTGVGFVQRLAVRDTNHLAFAFRSARLFYERLFGPGLVVLLATGLWMATTNWSLSLLWIRGALLITAVVLVLLYTLITRNYGRLSDLTGDGRDQASERRRAERITQLVGGGSSLLIVVVIWLMVAKPS